MMLQDVKVTQDARGSGANVADMRIVSSSDLGDMRSVNLGDAILFQTAEGGANADEGEGKNQAKIDTDLDFYATQSSIYDSLLDVVHASGKVDADQFTMEGQTLARILSDESVDLDQEGGEGAVAQVVASGGADVSQTDSAGATADLLSESGDIILKQRDIAGDMGAVVTADKGDVSVEQTMKEGQPGATGQAVANITSAGNVDLVQRAPNMTVATVEAGEHIGAFQTSLEQGAWANVFSQDSLSLRQYAKGDAYTFATAAGNAFVKQVSAEGQGEARINVAQLHGQAYREAVVEDGISYQEATLIQKAMGANIGAVFAADSVSLDQESQEGVNKALVKSLHGVSAVQTSGGSDPAKYYNILQVDLRQGKATVTQTTPGAGNWFMGSLGAQGRFSANLVLTQSSGWSAGTTKDYENTDTRGMLNYADIDAPGATISQEGTLDNWVSVRQHLNNPGDVTVYQKSSAAENWAAVGLVGNSAYVEPQDGENLQEITIEDLLDGSKVSDRERLKSALYSVAITQVAAYDNEAYITSQANVTVNQQSLSGSNVASVDAIRKEWFVLPLPGGRLIHNLCQSHTL